MTKPTRNPAEDLRGASRMAIDATQGITKLVEEMHRTIGSGPAVLGSPLAAPVGAITKVVYGGIGGVTGLVGAGIDGALASLAPLLREANPSAEHEAVLAVVNGVLGDYLHQTGNPLAISMQFRVDGKPMALSRAAIDQALPQASDRLLVLLHGSSMNDRQWLRDGHDHGESLASDLGYTVVHLHYNSGRHISTNGADFAQLLQLLVDGWPGSALRDVTLLTHSMGGLVARSACQVAESGELPWRRLLKAIVFLGTPHHGAPLERGGNWVDVLLGVSRYSRPLARLARIRSAGVTDLRHGCIAQEDWAGKDRFTKRPDPRAPTPLPEGVDCYAIAGTTKAGLAAALPGDGLVPVDSALGVHKKPAFSLAFPEGNTWVAQDTSHLELLGSAAVYERVQGWLGRSGG